MKCSTCGVELTGGLDTWGPIWDPVCYECHREREADFTAQGAKLKRRVESMKKEREGLRDEVVRVKARIRKLEGGAKGFDGEADARWAEWEDLGDEIEVVSTRLEMAEGELAEWERAAQMGVTPR